MTRVIRKESYDNVSNFTISRTDIMAIETDSSVILTEAVKQAVEVEYDELGYPNIGVIDLGVQYDHRVTWLHFNLDKLLWHLNKSKGYTEDTKYNYYTFKIAFARLDEKGKPIKTSVWEFDGVDFEIPRGLTKEAGLYQIVLMIEEYQQDDEVGNIKIETTDFLERFVAKPIKGRVTESFYNPMFDISDTVAETDQEAALVKPKILCTLTDNGTFVPETKELGQKHDSFTRYFKFNPRRISAHLNDFYVFAIFKQDDKFHYSMFERTSPDDPLDDYSASHPIIAWIPKEVYQADGMWRVAIIAFTGNLEHMNDLEEDNGDYYFYVSKETKMKVANNSLTIEDVTKEPVLSITANMLTELGEIIITSDDEIYQASPRTK